MSALLDALAQAALYSVLSFGLVGLTALPLLMSLVARHGIPRPVALIGLIPFLGLPLLFRLLLRTPLPA